MGQFGRPFKKCQTVKKLTSGGFSSVTTSAITSAAPKSKRGSSSTREMARFCCILGEYLIKEVVWMQIYPEQLTRPSTLAMVGGRCMVVTIIWMVTFNIKVLTTVFTGLVSLAATKEFMVEFFNSEDNSSIKEKLVKQVNCCGDIQGRREGLVAVTNVHLEAP